MTLVNHPAVPELNCENGEEKGNSYRYRVLENAVREHEIRLAFAVLRAAKIEPVLLKGWTVGRLYLVPGMRRLGDIDLLISDEKCATASKALQEHELNVDWHTLSDLKAEFAEPNDVVCRSELLPLLDTHIRALCPEDNLHFVAIHMLKHGGWSPVWLSDVAVLLASRQPDFDWHLCLGSNVTQAGWVLSALVLAHKLLGADISGTPAENHQIPDWMTPALLKAWKDPDPANNQPPEAMWDALTHPWRLPSGIRKRWPSPITAAIKAKTPFEQHSPLVTQLRYCAELAGAFFRRAMRS